MKNFILFLRRTLGGLALHYYITKFLFAGLLFAGVMFIVAQSGNELNNEKIVFLVERCFI